MVRQLPRERDPRGFNGGRVNDLGGEATQASRRAKRPATLPLFTSFPVTAYQGICRIRAGSASCSPMRVFPRRTAASPQYRNPSDQTALNCRLPIYELSEAALSTSPLLIHSLLLLLPSQGQEIVTSAFVPWNEHIRPSNAALLLGSRTSK